MSIDKYDPIRLLGEGSFGKVYLMRDKVRRNFVCVKVIKIKNIPKKEREATKLEVDLLRRLHHPNIVRYLDSFLSKNNETLCICMEYCDGGDLASQIKAARQNLFSESKILHWFVQLALGLHYMHSSKVLHRDLKTQNVFLLGNGRLVLGDLGISKVLDGTMDFAQTCIGTPYYMSPEIFSNKPYSYKSDVWALGCVLYEMTTLNHAFDANSLNGLAGKIIKGRYPPIHQKYSKHLRDLIGSMLQTNPQQRPDLDQILHKTFIRKHVVDFFADIASRPTAGIGEGTMLIRAAVGGPSSAALAGDSNLLALQKQLQDLDMADAVTEALQPKPKVPSDAVEAKKLVKDQASALRREEDHKRMVESALEKLRQERELRAKERQSVVPSANNGGVSRARVGVNQPPQQPMKPAAARQPVSSNYLVNNGNNVIPSAAAPGGVSRKSPAAAVPEPVSSKGAEAKDSDANNRDAPRRRRQTLEDQQKAAEQERELKQQQANEEYNRRVLEAAQKEKSEFRKRQEVMEQARLREEAKAREEQRAKEEAASRQRIDEMRAQAEAAAKREAQLRDKERARQREEIEQLKRDQLELDRRVQERDRAREEKRSEERKKIEDSRRAAGVGPVLNDGSDSQYSPRLSAGKDQYSVSNQNRAEDKSEAVTNRDRVMQSKRERAAREEQERADMLRQAEYENRQRRAQADALRRQQYEDSPNSVLPRPNPNSKPVGAVPMAPLSNADIASRLNDVNLNKPSANRYDDDADEIEEAKTLKRMQQRDTSDADSDEVSEDEELFAKNSRNDLDEEENAIDEDEDIQRREEELRAELNYATMRCQELHKTLQETKSFIEQNPDNRPIRPLNNKISTIESTTEVESDYEDNFEVEDSSDFVDPSRKSTRSEPGPSGHRGGGSSSSSADRDKTPPRRGPTISVPPKSVHSNYQNLQDPPTPSGKVHDRIKNLRQKCIEALGREAFMEVYQFLKEFESNHSNSDMGYYDADAEEHKKSQLKSILGVGKAHYASLIEQLIFMEETQC